MKLRLGTFLVGALIVPLALPALQSDSDTDIPGDPSAVGYLNLYKRHPDGYEGADEFNLVYTSDEAIRHLDRVRGFLERAENARLIEPSQAHNLPVLIEGTILKKEYELSQLRYQLAQLRLDRGEITSQELDQMRVAFEDATMTFQTFWDTKFLGD